MVSTYIHIGMCVSGVCDWQRKRFSIHLKSKEKFKFREFLSAKVMESLDEAHSS